LINILKTKFMNQGAMKKVLYSLMPILIFSVGTFGLRVLLLTIVSCVSALFSEWLFIRNTNKKFSWAVLVSALLYTLTLPPRTPFWIASIGMIFGIVFARETFGGFGKNVFNPAAAARAFVYVSFAKYLTAQWSAPATQFMGGFLTYTTEPIDVLAQSTPMLIYREIGVLSSYFDLFFGNVSGSIGEVSAFLIILSGIYLLTKKVAYKETVFSVIIGYFLTSGTLYLLGLPQVPNPLWGLLAGGLLFGAVFMATDPITSPKTFEGRIVYGLLIGSITVIIRAFALFAGGIMFAILIANIFVPITDEAVKHLKKGV
jgi:Na+-transporting NADH:ubiquinone oxidoreductase subunit B